MSQMFEPGDFLVYQLESGFALLRFLAVDETEGGTVWHVTAYSDFFPDIEAAEHAALQPTSLTINRPHIALTARAFQSTQVARLANVPLVAEESAPLEYWRGFGGGEVSDRSIRLMLGYR